MSTHPLHRAARRGSVRSLVIDVLNGGSHLPALLVYLLIVGAHFAEHALQIVQVFALGWDRPDAGGLLGLVFPIAAANETLHFTYNTLQLTGLILLAPGFRGFPAALRWWLAALALQSWHWLEHAFLIGQFVTGIYFYGAIKQMSILERFVPRIELHFAYNLLAFVPTVVALTLYLRARSSEKRASR
jgi:hypothetical protein